MAQQVVAATPEVLDTLRKARVLVNQTNLGQETVGGNTLPDNTIQITTKSIVPAVVKSGNGVDGYICDIKGNRIELECNIRRNSIFN
jgi:hypothetical protein